MRIRYKIRRQIGLFLFSVADVFGRIQNMIWAQGDRIIMSYHRDEEADDGERDWTTQNPGNYDKL